MWQKNVLRIITTIASTGMKYAQVFVLDIVPQKLSFPCSTTLAKLFASQNRYSANKINEHISMPNGSLFIHSVRLKLGYCLLVQGVFQEGELVKPGRCEKIHFFKLHNFKKHSQFFWRKGMYYKDNSYQGS